MVLSLWCYGGVKFTPQRSIDSFLNTVSLKLTELGTHINCRSVLCYCWSALSITQKNWKCLLVSQKLYHFRQKPVDTIGNCQRPVSSLAVSQHHKHEITNLWRFELDWSSELRDNYKRKKHCCHTKMCAFRCLILGPQVLNLRSQNQICGKVLTPLQREPFITMFWTTNLSPLFVTKEGFMLIIILSDYQ